MLREKIISIFSVSEVTELLKLKSKLIIKNPIFSLVKTKWSKIRV